MLDELEVAWAELDADPDVRVIVNTANGKAFCTGMDVVQVARDKDAMRRHSRRTRDAELKISAWHCGVWKPVIAAVNGVCAGGGLHLVADADIVIAAEQATFVDPHVSVGQAVAYEAITLLRKSPMEAITRMALSGKGRTDLGRSAPTSWASSPTSSPATNCGPRPTTWRPRSPPTPPPRCARRSRRCGMRSRSA